MIIFASNVEQNFNQKQSKYKSFDCYIRYINYNSFYYMDKNLNKQIIETFHGNINPLAPKMDD